jgi:hypothetical protein
MAYFQTKNPDLGKFWRVLQFGLFYGYLIYFVVIWYIFMNIWQIFTVWVCCTKKNLTALIESAMIGKCD